MIYKVGDILSNVIMQIIIIIPRIISITWNPAMDLTDIIATVSDRIIYAWEVHTVVDN